MKELRLTSLKKQNTLLKTENTFNEIYGHETTKSILSLALRSVKSAHVLLVSPPGMAKTQFLLAIRNLFKEESYPIASGNFDTRRENEVDTAQKFVRNSLDQGYSACLVWNHDFTSE